MTGERQEAPELLLMMWCPECRRIDWHIAFTHRSNGKRCPGLPEQVVYDKRA